MPSGSSRWPPASRPGARLSKPRWPSCGSARGAAADALESAERALELFARIPEHQRGGRTQGAAILAVVTHALVVASMGDWGGARMLSTAARAVVTPLDLDEAAFLALLARGRFGHGPTPPADCRPSRARECSSWCYADVASGLPPGPSVFAGRRPNGPQGTSPAAIGRDPERQTGVAVPDGGHSDDVEKARDRADVASRGDAGTWGFD